MWGLVGTDSGRERTGKERVYNGLRARTVAANEVIPNGLRPRASFLSVVYGELNALLFPFPLLQPIPN